MAFSVAVDTLALSTVAGSSVRARLKMSLVKNDSQLVKVFSLPSMGCVNAADFPVFLPRIFL